MSEPGFVGLKDEIIKNYLPPYLKKVNKLNEDIILIDSFAGPGKFDDGEQGSPLYKDCRRELNE